MDDGPFGNTTYDGPGSWSANDGYKVPILKKPPRKIKTEAANDLGWAIIGIAIAVTAFLIGLAIGALL